MNNREYQKKEERQFLAQFRECYPDFPNGKIEESEAPDFIVRPTTKRSLGIEITRIFFDEESIQNRNIEIRRKLINKALKSFQLSSNENLAANICFNAETPFERLNIKFLSEEISVIIQRFIQSEGDSGKPFWKIKQNLPKHIEEINLIHSRENQVPVWTSSCVKIFQKEFIESIKTSILKKQEKIYMYQSNVLDNYWLLIVADNIAYSAGFNINNLLERISFESSFEEIFLFDYFNRKIYTLNT